MGRRRIAASYGTPRHTATSRTTQHDNRPHRERRARLPGADNRCNAALAPTSTDAGRDALCAGVARCVRGHLQAAIDRVLRAGSRQPPHAAAFRCVAHRGARAPSRLREDHSSVSGLMSTHQPGYRCEEGSLSWPRAMHYRVEELRAGAARRARSVLSAENAHAGTASAGRTEHSPPQCRGRGAVRDPGGRVRRTPSAGPAAR